MSITSIVTISIYVLNILFALIVIFASRKSPSSTWAWLFVLFFLPIIGFVLYLLLGRNLQKRHFVRWQMLQQEHTFDALHLQQRQFKDQSFDFPTAITKQYAPLIQMNLQNNHAVLSTNNDVQLFATGKDKFEAVLADIERATQHIHVQYYIFKMDDVGSRITEALVKKARQGVEVKVIYDDLGSRKLRLKHFKELIDAGGEAVAFFPSFLALLNPRINFRNHRKLVIIDGEIGYIGGFNVGREYVSLDERFGFWRDMHLRIIGHSVQSMQAHFLFDWHQAKKIPYEQLEPMYFPAIAATGTTPVQIVSSGPDTDFESTKESYIRMMLCAKRYIYIQSPYFVPDAAFLHAIQIAASSGVDVRVMTPAKPDHPFIYGANSAYGGDLMRHGGRLFRYEKGFLHSKMMVIDDEICTVGTTNIDVRSFSLNFEINAIVYDEALAKQCRAIYEEDERNSFEMTPERYEQRDWWTKVREAFSRLISPIL